MARFVGAALFFLVSFTAFVSSLAVPIAQSGDPSESSPEEQSAEEIKAQRIAKKFQQLIERRPRFGTALDRFFGHHAERGSLDSLVEEYEQRTEKDPQDAKAWMMIALIQARRGRDKESIAAFESAEKSDPKDAVAPFYLAQRLMLAGLPDQAAEAFERCLKNEPAREHQLEALQTLGRLHYRAGRAEQALGVWDRLEKAFPRDLKVQESIASILVDENKLEDALGRYKQLMEKTRDAYTRVQFGIRVAEIQQRLGKKEDAIQQFEKLLAGLKPKSWLHRDVRNRIEDSYRQSYDFDGLMAYYEKWLKSNTDDVDAMGRLARIMSTHNRAQDAEVWFNKALELAPGDTSLRRLLIDQLIQDREYAAAIEQFAKLDEQDPGNPDCIRRWGELILKDASRSVEQQQADAADVWSRLLEEKDDDPVTVTTVADLFRSAKMTDRAIKLYRQAIELAPDEPRYREHLGEYFHTLKRSDEAQATWEGIASGKRRNTRNLVRLAEVYGGFGYEAEALESMQAACELDPEFSDVISLSQMLSDAGNFPGALEQLSAAEEMAATDEETDLVLTQRIETWQIAEMLDNEMQKLRNQLRKNPKPKAGDWYALALSQEAAMRLEDASTSIFKATELDDSSIRIWTVAARLTEKTGNLRGAVRTLRRLVDIDRRFRSSHLTKIASLELQMGKTDVAIETGRELLAAAPDNPEHFRFFANLCFQANKEELGLDALRRSVRVNPSDDESLLALASALGQRFRTSEAIEIYWRAFENAGKLDDKLAVIGPLADLHLRSGQIERLVRRLELYGRENNQPRETAYCLAATYRHISDPGTARQILEKLLVNNRDAALLQQLVQLAESDGDLELAIEYQEQVVAVSATDANIATLAKLQQRSGDYDESEKTWMKLLEGEQDRARLLSAIDDLTSYDQYDSALRLIERVKQANPRDWEILSRESLAQWKNGNKKKAAESAQQILKLTLEDDAKATELNSGSGRNSFASFGFQRAERPPLVKRMRAARPLVNSLGSWLRPTQPKDFGEARMFALAILHLSPGNAFDDTLQDLKKSAEQGSQRALTDVFYLESVRSSSGWMYQSQPEMRHAARKLSAQPTVETAAVCLEAYSNRSRYSKPLAADEIAHLRTCYRLLHDNRATIPRLCGEMVQPVLAELRRAGQDDAADELYAEVINSATDPEELEELLQHVRMERDLKSSLMVAEKLEAAYMKRGTAPDPRSTTYSDMFRWFIPDLVRDDSLEPILDLLSRHLTVMADRVENGVRGAAARRRFGSLNGPVMGTIYRRGPRYRFVSLRYPLPNEYFDRDAVLMLRNVYDICSDDVALSDLFALLKRGLDTAQDQRGAVLYHLARAYVYQWEENVDKFRESLQAAINDAPDDMSLRLELAKVLMVDDRPKEAIALIDAISPRDPKMLEKREFFILQNPGPEKARTRKAAETLLGLRIDRKKQEVLGSLLVSHEFEDLLESLAGKVGPINPVARMQEKLAEGNKDLASEIAHEVLHRARGTKQAKVRAAAIEVLSETGRMEPLIDRMKGQLSRAPRSYRLRQRLADYLNGVGRTDEAWQVYEDLATSGTGNARVNYELAEQFRNRKKYDSACDLYLAALGNNFSLMGNNYRYVEPVFKSAGRSSEFIELLMKSDLRKLGSTSYLSRTIQTMTNSQSERKRGLELLKYACNNWPEQRSVLLQSIGNLSNDPQVFKMCVSTILPDKDDTLLSPWQGLELYSLINRLLSMENPQRLQAMNNSFATPFVSSGRTIQLGGNIVWNTGRIRTSGLNVPNAQLPQQAQMRAQLQARLLQMQAQFGANHPSVKQVKTQIASLFPNLEQNNEKYLKQLQQQYKSLVAEFGREHALAKRVATQLAAMNVSTPGMKKPELPDKSDNLKFLIQQIHTAKKQHPEWLAGDFLLPYIEMYSGDQKQQETITKFVDDNINRMTPPTLQSVGWLVLNNGNVDMKSLAIRLYEAHAQRVATAVTASVMSGPAYELIGLYVSDKQLAKARQQARMQWKTRDYSSYSSSRAGYREYRELYDASRFVPYLRQQGLNVVAFEVAQDIIQSPALVTNAKKYTSTSDKYNTTVQKEYTLARNAISDSELVQSLKEMVAAKNDRAGNSLPNILFTGAPRAGMTIRSLMADAIVAAGQAEEFDFKRLLSQLQKRASEKPHDPYHASNLALARLVDPNDDLSAKQAVQELIEFAEKHPLKSGGALNSRERGLATRQINFWLVARQALQEEETREQGTWLKERVFEAAEASKSKLAPALQASYIKLETAWKAQQELLNSPSEPPAPALPEPIKTQ